MLTKWPILAMAAALVGIGGGSAVYVSHERANERRMAALNEALTSSLVDTQHQLEALNRKVAEMSEPKPAPVPSPAAARQKSAKRSGRTVAKAAPPREDPRIKELQTQLADQQKQIAGTRDDLDKTRGDLDKTRDELSGKLDSTRDELSTSIAKNHDEVVELQKRGERNYYEFQIDKSKQFQRVGPVRVSLRKADMKHRSFNVAMMVDDNELQKKNVNLYEPVWINLDGETAELVVNKIAKDHVEGYLSEPKYKRPARSESAANELKQPE